MRRANTLTYGLDWYTPGDEIILTLLEKFTVQIERRLPANHRELLDDVQADLYNVAKARALLGRQDPFWELMFEIHRAGAWPCGCRDFPNGELVELVAFVPTA
jgi:hypothetical protein